ncbi:hypothetical protein L6164_032082 [Bauhinia variegata]|uniref:Uncharacterized protein n=1 Tax=Bauhinia variegata TaxID=167791 RepID=A0ACB9KMY6_BAUVA|nr:hypothetical protein L6164_032082 [Bauhinia variegata]
MAIIDTDVYGGRGREDLALIFKTVIGLSHSYGEVAGGMRLQVRVPEKFIAVATASPAKTKLQRPVAQT